MKEAMRRTFDYTAPVGVVMLGSPDFRRRSFYSMRIPVEE
jgi:hypothetical protein